VVGGDAVRLFAMLSLLLLLPLKAEEGAGITPYPSVVCVAR